MKAQGSDLIAALRDLDDAANLVREVVDRLAIAAEVTRVELDESIEALVGRSRLLGGLVATVAAQLQVDVPPRTSRGELETIVDTLVGGLLRREDGRDRLQRIAGELMVGDIAARQATRRLKLVALKEAALTEVRSRADDQDVMVPWPAETQDDWILWLLALDEPHASEAHDVLRASLPALLEFVTTLHATDWYVPADNSTVAEIAPTAEAGPSAEAAPASEAGLVAEEALTTVDDVRVDEGASTISPPVAAVSARIVEAPQVVEVAETPLAADLQPTVDPAGEASSPVATAPVHVRDPEPDDLIRATPPSSVSPVRPLRTRRQDTSPWPIPAETSSPSRSATALAPGLPDELRTFAAYRDTYWRDAQGVITEVPWKSQHFASRLIANVDRAFADRRWRYLYLHATAAAALATTIEPPSDSEDDPAANLRRDTRRTLAAAPRPRDVEALIALLVKPTSAAAGVDAGRAARLFDEGAYPPATEGLRLALLLEAWRPCDGRFIDVDAARTLVATAGFPPEVAALVEISFRTAAEGLDAFDALRRMRAQGDPSPEQDLAEVANDAREKLHSEHRRLWSAAGGAVMTTHCRIAWQKFMEVSQEPLEALGGTRGSAVEPDLAAIDALARRYEQIANRGGVKYGDRARMDRAAEHLLDAAREVVLTRRRLVTDQRRKAHVNPSAALLEAALRAVPAASAALESNPYPALVQALLGSPVTPVDDPLVLSQQDFITWPALIETIPLVAGDTDNRHPIAQLANPVAASAIIISPFSSIAGSAAASASLAQRLRDVERTDLLVHLHPVSDRDARESAAALTRMQLDAYRALDDLDAVVHRLDEAAHPLSSPLRDLASDARELLKRPPHEVRPDRVTDWMSRVTGAGTRALEQTVEVLRGRLAESNPDRATLVTTALSEGRLIDAIAHLNGLPRPLESSLRACLPRPEAEARYRDPHRELYNGSSQSAALRREWSRGLRGDDGDHELRRAFAALVFDALKGSLADRKTNESVIQSRFIREWMTRGGLNPCFIPQISQFIELAVVLPPRLPTDDSFVRQTFAQLHRSNNQRIHVILAPKLTRSVRTAFRDEVRVRNASGLVIIDDIDVLRLLNPGGQQTELVLALLEIFLEQQPRWTKVTPFEAHEGQHTKAEMYVGRQEEAADLATKATYSRLFSGRRLGKSALLKHITDTHADRRLPSKNKLHVVYVGIVGEVDERKVVARIEQELRSQLDHQVLVRSDDPAERLQELVEPFMANAPRGDSLLVFLDEADMFIEAQIRSYEARRENALSWRMRTNLESKRDAMDLPRVRFVFAGYRATQRREGAWANWGDVLRLPPLSPEDGARLIAGPLARMGIDAARESSNIAFRCGYQPAVIIRFGQLLLEHLDEVVPRSARDWMAVTPAHVALVFLNPGLQQEIRTVVWNNFQGNPFGKIVFAALLLELARVPPGGAVEDAPRKVWERLQGIAPDFLEGKSPKGAPLDRVARELRTFVDRSLLVDTSSDRAAGSYALLFPHHLPVLLQEDQEQTVRQEVDAFGNNAMDEVETVRSLLTETSLDNVRFALAKGAEFTLRAAVAVSHWPPLLSQRAANLIEHLQVDDQIAHAEASASEAEWVLTRGPHEAPTPLMVGGLDLLRWAARRGGDVEVAAVRRLQPRQIQWWFERIRGITFDGPNPIARFVELTGGIPFLLELLDRELEQRVGFDGSTASIAMVAASIEGFREGMPAHLERLRDGGDTVRLERRERELLVMYVLAARDWGRDWQVAAQDWEAYGEAYALPAIRSLGPSDATALEVLLGSGLLPLDPYAAGSRAAESIDLLAANDPLHAMSAVMAEWLST